MLVQKVLAPGRGTVSWTVVDERFEPVPPVEAYLAHLEAVERSPNTVRAYASSLRLFFEFLGCRDRVWDEVGLDELGRFASWLRRPSHELVIPIDAAVSARAASTVNRHLAAVFSFYDFHARFGVAVAGELVDWRRGGRGSYKPFLEGIGGRSRKTARRPVRLRTPRRLPETLSPEQVAAILAACEHLRDRLLVALLAETGMRVGQALGLRHYGLTPHLIER